MRSVRFLVMLVLISGVFLTIQTVMGQGTSDGYTEIKKWVSEVIGYGGRVDLRLGEFDSYDAAQKCSADWSNANPRDLRLTREREIMRRIYPSRPDSSTPERDQSSTAKPQKITGAVKYDPKLCIGSWAPPDETRRMLLGVVSYYRNAIQIYDMGRFYHADAVQSLGWPGDIQVTPDGKVVISHDGYEAVLYREGSDSALTVEENRNGLRRKTTYERK